MVAMTCHCHLWGALWVQRGPQHGAGVGPSWRGLFRLGQVWGTARLAGHVGKLQPGPAAALLKGYLGGRDRLAPAVLLSLHRAGNHVCETSQVTGMSRQGLPA